MDLEIGPWVAALAGGGFIGGLALLVRGMGGYRTAARIADMSTSKIGSVAAGEVRISGVIEPAERYRVPDVADAPAERQLWLVRHGETEWARLGRHTGRTDVPLTALGREQAVALGRRLAGHPFELVLTSPLSRAAETARLAGFGDRAAIEPNLREWDYGDLEGRLTVDIRRDHPGWTIWTGPWPGGETADQVAQRADSVLARCLDPGFQGDVLVLSHGHLLRVLAARWLRLPPASGSLFALATATVSILGWDRGQPVIETWNEACHFDR